MGDISGEDRTAASGRAEAHIGRFLERMACEQLLQEEQKLSLSH